MLALHKRRLVFSSLLLFPNIPTHYFLMLFPPTIFCLPPMPFLSHVPGKFLFICQSFCHLFCHLLQPLILHVPIRSPKSPWYSLPFWGHRSLFTFLSLSKLWATSMWAPILSLSPQSLAHHRCAINISSMNLHLPS